MAFLLAVLDAAFGQAVRVPGSSVSLVPPDGFLPARQFPGFQRDDLQASIMVTEMPGPSTAMMEGMTKQSLARQGLKLIAARPLAVEGRPAVLLHLGQKVGPKDYRKWMLVTGDENTTVLVVATFPVGAAPALSDGLQRSVSTVSWRAETATDPFEGLLFRISPSARLKIARRMSNMVMLTESGSAGALGPDDALYVVGNSTSRAAIDDVRTFSESRIAQTAQLSDVRNFTGRHLTVDGLEAYEIVADAKDRSSGAAMKVYQVVVPDGTVYFIMQGLISAGRAEEGLQEFRRVTESFARAR